MPRKRCQGLHLKKARLTKTRPSRSSEAIKKRGQCCLTFFKIYINSLQTFSDLNMSSKGLHRTPQENQIHVYAIIASLRRHLKAKEGSSSLLVKWHAIDKEVADDFHVRREYIRDLREAFHEDGEFPCPSGLVRGFSPGASPSNHFKAKMTFESPSYYLIFTSSTHIT